MWKKVNVHGEKPKNTSSNVIVHYKRKLYSFGGYDGGIDERTTKEVYEFDILSSKWKIIDNSFSWEHLQDHSGFVHEKFFYIIGGYSCEGISKNIYRFDLEERVWSIILPKNHDVFQERFNCVCKVYSKKKEKEKEKEEEEEEEVLLVIGGSPENRKLNSLLEYSFESNSWMIISDNTVLGNRRVYSGDISGHQLFVLTNKSNEEEEEEEEEENYAYLYDTELFCYNLTYHFWIQLDSSENPIPRPFFANRNLHIIDGIIYVFGGVNWEIGDGNDEIYNDKMMFFHHYEMLKYDIALSKWETIKRRMTTKKEEKEKEKVIIPLLSFSASCVAENHHNNTKKLYLFGGLLSNMDGRGDQSTNDLYEFQIPQKTMNLLPVMNHFCDILIETSNNQKEEKKRKE